MFKNYIKIAFRNLIRHKAYSFINIAGLAIGMSCSILILLWVQDELSYDRFHPNAENTYRITATLAELDIKAAVTPSPIGPAYKNELPEVEHMVRVSGLNTEFLQVGDKLFEEKRILFADSNFLQFFSFPLAEGDAATAMNNPEGMLITQEMAKKYFGSESALGKTIRKNHKEDFTITGVLADLPSNSHLQFDFVQPMAFLARTNRDLKENVWDNFNFYTYVHLGDHVKASADAKATIEGKFLEIYKRNQKDMKVTFQLQPLTAIHLHSNFLADFPGHGNAQYVYIFIIVGIFILAVACINFMNLATARSARRAKEVGLRKVAGAVRFQLIRQFLSESSLISFIALALSVLIVFVTLPAFNNLSGKMLSISIFDPQLVIGLIAITLLTGLLAGSYPALFLSGFVPAKVLKGDLKAGAGGSLFRNTMVIIQFTVSIILLVGTAVIYNQLQFIQTRNPGYDKENLVYAPMTGDLWKNYETLRSSLQQHAATSNFSFVSDLPTNMTNGTIGVDWDGKEPGSQPLFCNMAVDENFIDVFRVTLLTGRGFSKDIKADTANYIVNEKALKILGMEPETAIGKRLTFWQKKGMIIGVIKDFNFKPVQQEIEPMILRLNTWGSIAVIRTQPASTKATIDQMEKIFKELNPEFPFSFNFIDKDLEHMYQAEQRLGNLFTIFAGLAIFISCLGLYGLSAFLAERRTKEIGVRKVLGASVFQVVYLLSKTFTPPIVIAMVIAVPIAYYAMNRWLESFAFHIDIHWSIFVFAFVVSLLIAWLTISYESIKAAMMNPSKSLKDE